MTDATTPEQPRTAAGLCPDCGHGMHLHSPLNAKESYWLCAWWDRVANRQCSCRLAIEAQARPAVASDGLADLFDPENAPTHHGPWRPERKSDLWLTDDDNCSLEVTSAEVAALVNAAVSDAGSVGHREASVGIKRVRLRAAARDTDDFRDQHERAFRDHILGAGDKPHTCDDLCSEAILARLEGKTPLHEYPLQPQYASDAGSVGALDVERLARASHLASRASEGTFAGPDCECREFAIDLSAAYDAERQGDG